MVLEHPAYSPDLNPCDYDGFHRIKGPNKGIRFANENELIKSFDKVIKDVNEKNELKGISKLPERWENVVEGCGEYIV
jgi:hypothetical protein